MSTRSLATIALLALPTFLACGDKEGDDTGGDATWMPYCEATETPLAFDEASPLGFSAADLVAGVGSSFSAPLTWVEAGPASTLALELSWSSDVTFVDLEEATPPDDGTAIADIAVICDDYIVVGATLDLNSADGLLADSFSVDLSAMSVDGASFSLELETSDFSHPEVFTPHEDPSADTQHPRLGGSFAAGGGSQGELSWIAEGSGDGTAWQSGGPVATWQTDLE